MADEDGDFTAQIKKMEDDITHAPKRERQPRGSSKFSITKTRESLTMLLEALNGAGNAFIKGYAQWQLQPEEIKELSDAIAEEIKVSPRLQAVVTKASAITPHAQLINCVGKMAVSRYLLYLELKAQGVAHDDGNPGETNPENPSPVPVGIGAAFDGNRGDGLWQN